MFQETAILSPTACKIFFFFSGRIAFGSADCAIAAYTGLSQV
jgi:hypothetical protein